MQKLQWKTLMPYLMPVLVIFLVNIIYFSPQLEGKLVQQGDFIQYQGMSKEALDFEKKTGRDILWTNSMFGGMPTFQINAKNNGNYIGKVDRILTFGIDRPIGMFVACMLGFYILLILIGINPWLSLLGALFFGLSTNNLILYEAGHVTKLRTIGYGFPALAGIILAYKGRYLLGASIFALFFGLNIFSNHPQMTYYLGFVVLIMTVFYGINYFRNNKGSQFIKASFSLVVAALLSLGASTSMLWTTYEYSESTMRGKPVLASTGEKPVSSSETIGLEWEYAMSWSNGYRDLLASFIPKAVGGGSGEWVSKNSEFAKQMKLRQDLQLPTYWGELPFTSGPAYFGAIVFFLFLFGAFAVKGELKWWLVISVLFTFLLSLGKNFSALNQILFDYLPLFNKFRTPNSVLSVTAGLIPILGILGLAQLVKSDSRDSYLKPLYYAYGIMASICILLLLFGSSIFSFSGSSDENYKDFIDALVDQRKSMLFSSTLHTFLLISVSAGLIYGFIKNKLATALLVGGIGVLGVGDLFFNGKSYLGKENFVNKRQYEKNFVMRPVDKQILEDKDPNYRVYDATVNTFNSASPSYYHKTIGGYHAAKLQRYQDIIDRHISKNNQKVLNMLNTKYIIFKGNDDKESVQRNPAALGNAWFVNKIILVDNANAEIDSLTSFDPTGDVVVHKEFEKYVSGLNLQKEGEINLKTYEPDRLVYSSNTNSEQLAVFSEVWYGPDKGWQAYIDGKPVDHIRVNYVLRGLKVPAGKHEIVFEFKPASFYSGTYISVICSILIFVGLGFAIYQSFNKNEPVSVDALNT
ncbi:MAG: YfhO family protein [Saprospiraceae bacterium]|nr:YfhO family protein [Saprospiraceae bacterium]